MLSVLLLFTLCTVYRQTKTELNFILKSHLAEVHWFINRKLIKNADEFSCFSMSTVAASHLIYFLCLS